MDRIETIFNKYNGVMSTAELVNNGIYYNRLQQLLENGKVEKIRRGYYQYISDYDYSEISLLVKMFPDGILCLESALDYYGYTDRTPSVWHIAVKNTSTRTRFYIDYPFVKPHFVNIDRYMLGVTEVSISEQMIKIYDREKTICDILLHKNKLDIEVYNNAVQRYITDPNKNLANLIPYARVMHVEKKVREVLEIWL